MPRPLRLQTAGYVHHVVARGNDRQVLFKSPKDFHKYIDLLEEARKIYPLKVYNYVLMDNHVHLLVEPTVDGSLSKVMESVTKAYAKYFNLKYNHVGHVFQGRFKNFIVQEERYFLACMRYIDFNPVKAGIVKDSKDYPWSGHKALAHGQKTPIRLDIHAIYDDFGGNLNEKQIGYRAFINTYQGEEMDLLNQRAGALGDRAFKKEMKNK